MAATRYKEAYDQMVSDNKELFDSFRQIHDEYALNSSANSEKFNETGKLVMAQVRRYEDILCKRSETHGFGEFTSKLAEKFQNEVRKNFPKIDEVGVVRKIMKPIETKSPSSFRMIRPR